MVERTVEILVGLFVAAGLAALAVLALQVSDTGTFTRTPGYTVTAYFDNIGGLRERAPVRAGGVRIGRVAAIEYDQRTYKARVRLHIDAGYDRLPADTIASIHTSGLLGEQFVSMEPGGDIDYLADGDVVEYTESAIVLERLIGQFMYQRSEQ